MWVRSLGWEAPLEKEMETHPSILVWEIPWTEEPWQAQSMGLSCGAREVRSPCAWRGGARPGSRVTGGV